MIKTENILPLCFAIGDLLCAIVFLAKGKPSSAWYWFAATQITIASILMSNK